MEKFLSISGFGDVSERHYESGIVLARQYFLARDLDFYKCYNAYVKDETSELGLQWIAAEREANLALYAFNLQDSSMLELELADEEVY